MSMCEELEGVTTHEWQQLVHTVSELSDAEKERAAREQRNSGILKGMMLFVAIIVALAGWQLKRLAELPPNNMAAVSELKQRVSENERRDSDHHSSSSHHTNYTDLVKLFMPRSEQELVHGRLRDRDDQLQKDSDADIRDLKEKISDLERKQDKSNEVLLQILDRLPKKENG